MKISKVIIGIVAMLSLSACNRGSKVSYERFVQAAKNLKEDDLKKAHITYKNFIKSDFSDSGHKREYATGLYLKDSLNGWQRGSDNNDSEADMIFASVIRDMLLSEMVSDYSNFEINSSNATKSEQKFYIAPFSCYGYSKSESSAYGLDNKSVTTHEYRYEWNEYGYLTYAEMEEEINTESNGAKYSSITKASVKIAYR